MAESDYISCECDVGSSCQSHKTKGQYLEETQAPDKQDLGDHHLHLYHNDSWDYRKISSCCFSNDIRMEQIDNDVCKNIKYNGILETAKLVEESDGKNNVNVPITMMLDRCREQQIMKQCNTGALDDDICDCVNFNVNVQREGHCKNTIKFCKMLQRPFNAGITQQLKRIIRKYQPLLSGIPTVFNHSNVKLHFKLTFLLPFILLTVIQLSGAKAVISEHGRQKRAANDSRNDYSPVEFDGLEYLMKFGFLPQSDVETGALRSKQELVKSIKSFQKFAGLRVTGTFDDATKERMQAKRCGVADVSPEDEGGRSSRHHHGLGRRRSRRYALGASKWEQSEVTYRILNFTPDLRQEQSTDAIRRAFDVWSRVTLLDFREVYSGQADILIKFARGYHADGYPFDGPGLILAHAFYPGRDRGGDMHFDEDETWTYQSYEGTNLFSVAAHEIGHSLGLAHSSVPGSLMYPWYQGYTPNFQLHSDDIAGINYLYGKREYPFQPKEPANFTNPPPRGTRDTPLQPLPTKRPTTPRPTTPRDRERPTYRPTDRQPQPPYSPVPSVPTGDTPPDPCKTKLDAVSVFRSEVFLFKGKWFWRRDENGIMSGYPARIDRFWYGLPDDFDGIDAVYERGDGKIVFFKGKRYWIFDANNLYNTPREGRPISELGFPEDLEKVDAAFVWGYNGKTYFMSGDMYWKYDEHRGHMVHNYPRDIGRVWKGVPFPVDAAFLHWDGHTYFFKDDYYYQLHDARMKVRKDPGSVAKEWLGCKVVNIPTDTDKTFGTDASSGNLSFGSIILAFICSAFSLLL